MATNYSINYEDEKFKQVEEDKNAAINEMNNTYNNMIGSTDKYYQDQINAANEWAKKQQELQQQNTDFAIDQINQQKDQANKDYQKEQAGAYVDWQKQSNQYGANAEQQAAQGLNNTGYSESSQVSMYNQYQSRVATARESFNKAVLNYDNAIKDAQLQNNSKLAEIAYNALQTQLELSLQGFQYKNQLILDQVAQKQQLENTYYSRYQDVLNQMNTENAMQEQIRQFNENLALEREQLTEQIRQFELEYNEGIRQFDTQIAYYREKDAQEYALKIKQLEEQKRQFEAEQKLKQQQLAQEQARWQKEYDLAKQQAAQQKAAINKTQQQAVITGNDNKSGTPNTAKQSSYYNTALSLTRTIYNTARKNKLQAAETLLASMVAENKITSSEAQKILKNIGAVK